MALSQYSSSLMPKSISQSLNFNNKLPRFHHNNLRFVTTKCELKDPSPKDTKSSKLEIGSPIVVVEAPKFLKTADSMPCLRANPGLVKPGDVGRILSRKPKDVWAVRLSIGTYLIDGKYFKPLEVDE